MRVEMKKKIRRRGANSSFAFKLDISYDFYTSKHYRICAIIFSRSLRIKSSTLKHGKK